MKKRWPTILQYIVFLGLGLFLAWWSVKDLNPNNRHEVRAAMDGARYWLIAPVALILLASHYVRALRWNLLIQPLGYKPKKINLFFAVMIGYLTNQAAPRAGEIIKCTMLARYENIPTEKLIGTIIVERVVDILTACLILLITFLIQPDLYSSLLHIFFFSDHKAAGGPVHHNFLLIILVSAVLIFSIAWIFVKKKSFGDIADMLKKILSRIWQGISVAGHLKKRAEFIFLTVLLWFLYFIAGYIGFWGLKETGIYGWKEAFAILSAGTVGMAATPGGIGAYAYLVQKTMMVYGLNKGTAFTFGLVLWVVQASVIIVGGIISFIFMPWLNKKYRVEKN
jgi:glycosyltransferase 2 family protein